MSSDPTTDAGAERATATPQPAGVTEARPTTVEPTGTGAPDRPEPPRSFARTFLDEVWSANPITVTVLAFVLALLVGAVLIVVSDPDVLGTYNYFFAQPGTALQASWEVVSSAYANLFKGAVVDPAAVSGWLNGENGWQLVFAPISETLTYTAPLVFTGLAVAVAFRGGLFDIGAEGQVILGAIVAGLAGFLLHLPVGLHVLVALLAGAAGGALWGYIPGVLKARTGAHEVITTIMLNYVALYFLGWLIVQKGIQDPDRTDAISKKVDDSARLPLLLGGSLRVHLGILLAIAVTAGIAWMLNRSTFGFELRAVGLNPDAARTAGIHVGRTYALVMAVAGGLAGLAGANMLLGPAHTLTGQVSGGVGFDGITVALLGRAKPWGVALAALFFGALRAGGNRMQSYAGVPVDMVTVLQALIVIFVAAPALVRTIFRLRAARAGQLQTTLAKGW